MMMLVSLQCVHSALVTFAPILSSRALSDAVASCYRPGDVIVVNGAYEDASTLNFYGHLPLHVLNSRENGDLYYGSLFPDSPALFEDDASFARLWRAPVASSSSPPERDSPAAPADRISNHRAQRR